MLPATAFAQREEIVQLQREMSQVQERIRLLEQVNASGFENIQAMLQQALASSGELSVDLDSLETRLTESMSTQQGMVAEPVQEVRSRMNGVSQNVEGLREDVATLNRRMLGIETALEDISKAVRQMATQQTSALPPPPPSGNAEADMLMVGVLTDLQSGKLENAMAGAIDYLQRFPEMSGAPKAQISIGRIYEQSGQFEDAIQAYDAVLEQYPENPDTRDAMFAKGALLGQVGRNGDAITTLETFVERYPTDANVQRARALIDEMR